ncbi:MAG: helix-hairpin-helix domain-containing protein [Bacteroidetes bacterium]|nr:helix-hairpin-helix domain-containing protein [Bacteroidota bacterium]
MCSLNSSAQTTPPTKTLESDFQQQLENVAESIENENADYSNLLEDLIYYKEHPINLNHTNKEELEQIKLLNDIQINNLLTHIKKNGKLITIYEIQSIDGFDLQTIQQLLPYIYLADDFSSPHFSVKEMFKNGENTVLFRYGRILENQTGFKSIDSAALFKSPNSRYIGSPDKLYLRYRFTYGTNVSWGITAEKDQGELFFKNKQKFKYNWYEKFLGNNQKTGFDFYSAHFYLHNFKYLKALAIGDYQLSFGQGLTAWSGYSFGKGGDILNVKKSTASIRPYTSVDENKFMRGIATTFAFKQLEASAFISRKHVDANIIDTSESAEITSLQETGYHTTAAEIADKQAILQTIYGGNISYKNSKLNIGLTALKYQLDKHFTGDLLYYQKFNFSSNQNFNIGLDYSFIIHNFSFFGEESWSINGGMAYLNGIFISLDPRVSFTVLHRYYLRNFQNDMSNAFSENTTAVNEKGLYTGITIKPSNSTSLTAYYDRFEFPWLQYRINAPAHGNDYITQFNYTQSKKFDIYFKIRQRNKDKNISSSDAAIAFPVPTKQTNYRFNISYTILPSIKLTNRLELINYTFNHNKTQKGYLVYQDVMYKKPGTPLSITFRYALFHTDTYDTRIYSYENDMPGVYSISSYYNRGSRVYVLIDYNLSPSIELWLRYSQTLYDNKNIISEGSLSEIQGNTRSEIKAQIRIKF